MRLAVGGTRKVRSTTYILTAMLQVSRTLSKSDSHAFIHLLHATEGSEAELGLGNAVGSHHQARSGRDAESRVNTLSLGCHATGKPHAFQV